MSHPSEGRFARPSLEQLKKQAKELLRDYRAGEESAVRRFAANGRPGDVVLADAQFVLAREHGFDTWAELKHHFEKILPGRMDFYARLAADVHAAGGDGNTEAAGRLCDLFGFRHGGEQLRTRLLERFGSETVTPASALVFVAKLYGFDDWEALAAGAGTPRARSGRSATPPFYRVDWQENWIEPRPPLSPSDWDEILAVIAEHGIAELRSAGQMTGEVLERVARLPGLRRLQLEGSWRVTDTALRPLARMPNLESLNLTGCQITDQGLSVLGELGGLREFQLFHHRGVSDAGLANLRHCPRLERVELLGSASGDGTIRALAGEPGLRHFKSGDLVTDAGLPLLAGFPAFATWTGGEPRFTLMGFDAEPNYLLLRGQITDAGLRALHGLDGLFALNLDDSRLSLTAAGVRALAALPHLGWLGFDATDDTMPAIAALPHLRMLMCQDTGAGEKGWTALSRSRTLQHIWGRRCYGLNGTAFRALAAMPALRGLAASCRNVPDDALAALPEFPSLAEFMPMDVPDAGFRHIAMCRRLESLWCMYCRETGDEATAHIRALPQLRTYYAGQTRITDRSLEMLSTMETLEKLEFWSCAGLTSAGIALLRTLPRLRELTVDSSPGVSRQVQTQFPPAVRVRVG